MTAPQSTVIKAGEALQAFCRRRHEIEVNLADCDEIIRCCSRAEGSHGADLILRVELHRRGYFKAGCVGVEEIRLGCVLHWPWPPGLPIPLGSGGEVVRSTLKRPAITRRANSNPQPIDLLAMIVTDAKRCYSTR